MLNAWGFAATVLAVLWAAGAVRVLGGALNNAVLVWNKRVQVQADAEKRESEYQAWLIASQEAERAAKAKLARLDSRHVADLPEDLEAVVMQESEKWARDELRTLMRDRYIEHGDWNRVRASVGIGTMDTPVS